MFAQGAASRRGDFYTAAVREVYEETGIKQLDLVKKLGTYERDCVEKDGTECLKEITIFLFRTNEEKLNPLDIDNPEARWVEINKVAEILAHPKNKEFFRSVIDAVKDC